MRRKSGEALIFAVVWCAVILGGMVWVAVKGREAERKAEKEPKVVFMTCTNSYYPPNVKEVMKGVEP